jgi:hypothetical protein
MSAYKKKKKKKYEEARQVKTFYVSGKYEKTSTYTSTKRNKRSHTHVDEIPFTKTVQARNEEEAKKNMPPTKSSTNKKKKKNKK